MIAAVVADELGPPENYSLRRIELAPPGPREVRIKIKAVGVSFVDQLAAAGRYQAKPPVPFTPGSECAGVVTAVGSEVSGIAPGQAVMATGWAGMFAEAANVRADTVWPMPGTFTFAEGAVFLVSYLTAWHALKDRGQLVAGESLLVLGAGGATGLAAVQIGKHLGARVIGSASSEEKRALALRGGAAAIVDARDSDWRKAVKVANGGHPVDVVFDPVGGAATEPAFRALGYSGRHLIVGFPGGIATLPTNLPLLKEASLVGVSVAAFGEAAPERSRRNNEIIIALANQGVLRPLISKSYPLEQFAQAMADAATGKHAGRIVMEIA